MKCIKFRRVVNDAVAWPWEDMPEVQPATLKGLVEYLKICPGWDFRRLSTEYQGWDSHQVSYGMRALFWIPVTPTESDFEWIKEETQKLKSLTIFPCFCGKEVSVDAHAGDMFTGVGGDVHMEIKCDCGVRFGNYQVKSDLIQAWNKMHKSAPQKSAEAVVNSI